MNVARKVIRAIFPPPRVAPDGRAEWPSRTPYVLASMGGAMGGAMGFVVYPYILAICFLAIPVLVLGVAIGQGYRSGCVIAYNSLDRRFTGVGFGMVCIGYAVAIYYIPILSWVMVYFRNSFQSADNFPWNDNPQAYFDQVVNKVPAIPAEYNGGDVTKYATYPGTGVDGELIGFAFTARVVYITIVLPVILTVVLVGRRASLPNSGRGIKLYFGEFNGGQLAGGQIWQAACSQVFCSTGVGFGYYTAYASYNSKFADAVQDAIIICSSNALFESFAAFAVFGVVGFLNLQPGQGDPVGTYTLGFYTLPSAIREMPGAPFWAVLFFLALFLLGISPSFALLDAMITTICDTHWGRKYKHLTIATIITIISALLSIFYSTNTSLIAVVWCECVVATSFYRCVNVIGQVGALNFWIYQVTYIGSMAIGNVVAHTVQDKVGVSVGFGVFILGTVISILVAKDPTVPAPKFWGCNKFSSCVWWAGLYLGHQLANDLNYVVCVGKQLRLPVFRAPILRHFAAPVLSIVFCLAYPSFYAVHGDPLNIFGFTVAHLIIAVVLAGFIPKSINIFVPPERRDEGNRQYAPRTVLGEDDPNIVGGVTPGAEGEAGLSPVDYREEGREELSERFARRYLNTSGFAMSVIA